MIPVEPKPNVTNTATHTKKTQWTKEIQKNKHTAIVRPARLRRGGGEWELRVSHCQVTICFEFITAGLVALIAYLLWFVRDRCTCFEPIISLSKELKVIIVSFDCQSTINISVYYPYHLVIPINQPLCRLLGGGCW